MRKPKALQSIRDLVMDTCNANRHTQCGGELMHESISSCGFGDSLTVDRNGKIISGHQRAETLAELDMMDAVVVQSDGTRPIVHQRTDLDLNTDEKAKRLALLQNRVGELNLDWDPAILDSLKTGGMDFDGLWNPDEWDALLAKVPNIEFPERTEDVAEEVKYHTCPECGHKWPA